MIYAQRNLAIIGAIVACSLVSCSRSPNQTDQLGNQKATGIVTVHVVNYPLKYFAERIGGEHVRVVFPAPADVDPAFWSPDVQAIANYQQSELILLNGATYESWVKTVSLPESRLVNTSASFSDQYIKLEDSVTHSHGPGGEHAHAGTAFTTWLDPQLAIAQADAIRQALVKQRPQHENVFQQNFSSLQADLNDLDAKLAEIFDQPADHPVVFSHPVYQYLSRKYSLNAKSVHWEPEEIPSAKMWDELASLLEQHPAKWMIWEGKPVAQNVDRLSELGLQSTVFDPCGNTSEKGDYLTIMQQNIENVRQVFTE
jgi:zinc transport system substrate-binding protein